jgi:hypothetical protein
VRTARRELTAAVLLPVLLPVLLLTGCAQSVDPIERLGKKAAHRVDRPTAPARTARRVSPYRRWGLPAPPAVPPGPPAAPPARTTDPGLPPALDHIRTRDRVVFLTYDHDADATVRPDPRFADLVRDLRLPVTALVTTTGTGLRGLPYTAQRTRICGRQDRPRPRFIRPPGGAYDTTTLRAAADCGTDALILWRAAMTTGTLTFTRRDRHLHPGDIVQLGPEAAPGGPSLRTRTVRLLRRMQREGLAAGRLEDYL